MRPFFYFLILNICLIGFNPLSAQENQSKSKTSVSKAEKENDSYAEKLNLSEEQSEKFEAINKTYQEEINALKIKSKTKQNTRKLKTLEKERDKALENLLSEEQFEKYLEMRRQERGRLKTLIRKSNGQ